MLTVRSESNSEKTKTELLVDLNLGEILGKIRYERRTRSTSSLGNALHEMEMIGAILELQILADAFHLFNSPSSTSDPAVTLLEECYDTADTAIICRRPEGSQIDY